MSNINLTQTGADADKINPPISPVPLSPSGLGTGSWVAMWLIILILLVIALPKHLFSPGGLSAVSVTQTVPGVTGVVPAPIQAASGALAVSAAAAPAPDMVRPIAEIAKMTLDASKEKYDSIKDTYDRLFSVLVAMAALLTFLGFKGLDSFVGARASAEASELRAAQAEARAKEASDKAESANLALQKFLNETNKIKNRAELNVSSGIALRETARVYRDCWMLVNPARSVDEMPADAVKVYRDYLEMSRYYLNVALEQKATVDDKVILRAMGTLCNVHRALNDFPDALRVAQNIIADFPKEDDTAYFNAACYCSLLGNRFASVKLDEVGANYAEMALGYLRTAIALDPINRAESAKDDDFTWLKLHYAAKFDALTA